MFGNKIKMWSILINCIPAARLESWSWWLGVFAIVLPLLGGVCGWLSFEMNDTVTHNKEAEMQRQIAEAKAAALPKPYKVRLIAFLNTLDPNIMKVLAEGRNRIRATFDAAQFADMQRLAAEPGSSEFISFHPDPEMPYTGGGILYSGSFELTKELLKP